ncbi:hypothetical protein CMV_019601 [Castanea mollissima]|uniref:Uncharacterized protein n=1 Tax=Castanea mollissima TaxID=60419 RepID=A0A8J4VEF1_9ROSI|nr:hypothetical protein CMV_019601 [Castanea mollissima]
MSFEKWTQLTSGTVFGITVVSFWNFWGFTLVWLDYIAWQEDIGHLTMMLFTLHGLFNVIARGNLLQETCW